MKKVFSIIGIAVGIAFVIIGCLSIFGALGGNTTCPFGASYGYDHGYGKFGADYYTYSVNNSAEAAEGAMTAARNLRYIGEFMRVFSGIFSILVGLTVVSGFGIVLATCKKKIANAVPETIVVTTAPEAPAASEANPSESA